MHSSSSSSFVSKGPLYFHRLTLNAKYLFLLLETVSALQRRVVEDLRRCTLGFAPLASAVGWLGKKEIES